MKWKLCGPNSFLFQFADQPGDAAARQGRAINRYLETRSPAGLSEFVLGLTTVLLEFADGQQPNADALARELNDLTPIEETPRLFDIPVVYDGEDLGGVSELNGLSVQEVVRLHSESLYTVLLIGFAPGFPYLGGLNPRLRTPRLPNPRPKVRAGSVAIAGEHTSIYPVETPGGWNIIGHTDFRLFNPSSQQLEDIFPLRVGDQIRFHPSL